MDCVSYQLVIHDVEWIKWSEQDYWWVDDLGNCYMSVIDIPEDLMISWVANPSLMKYYSPYINGLCFQSTCHLCLVNHHSSQ